MWRFLTQYLFFSLLFTLSVWQKLTHILQCIFSLNVSHIPFLSLPFLLTHFSLITSLLHVLPNTLPWNLFQKWLPKWCSKNIILLYHSSKNFYEYSITQILVKTPQFGRYSTYKILPHVIISSPKVSQNAKSILKFRRYWAETGIKAEDIKIYGFSPQELYLQQNENQKQISDQLIWNSLSASERPYWLKGSQPWKMTQIESSSLHTDVLSKIGILFMVLVVLWLCYVSEVSKGLAKTDL